MIESPSGTSVQKTASSRHIVAYTDPYWARNDNGGSGHGLADIERTVLGPNVELRLGVSTEYGFDVSESAVASLLPSISALVVYRAMLTAKLVRAIPATCRAVIRQGDGLDNLDLDALRSRGIAVYNVPDYCIDEASTHAMALILSSERDCYAQDRLLKAGQWDPRGGMAPRRLSDLRLGLVGLGRLGTAIAVKARPFFGSIAYHDPGVNADRSAYLGLKRLASVEELVANVDIVAICASLNPSTRRMFDRTLVLRTRNGAGLVNVARGQIVDNGSILEALDSGHLRWYATDVFDDEPPQNELSRSLSMHPQVVGTCHRAFFSLTSETNLRLRVAEALRAMLVGQQISSLSYVA